MTGASIETTLELWASSLRDLKGRMRGLFTQERVATSANLFLDGLLGAVRRKTGWMRAEAAGDPGPRSREAVNDVWQRLQALPDIKTVDQLHVDAHCHSLSSLKSAHKCHIFGTYGYPDSFRSAYCVGIAGHNGAFGIVSAASGPVPKELSIDSQGPSLRPRLKGGAQAIDTSRGGITSKIHCLADDLGRPVTIVSAPGNVADVKIAISLVEATRPTRYDRLGANYLSAVFVAALIAWI